jgi:hypothetical protein
MVDWPMMGMIIVIACCVHSSNPEEQSILYDLLTHSTSPH